MNTPTAEQIAKLPKWARDYTEQLTRERDRAQMVLDEYRDEQKPSHVYTRSGLDPRRYLQTDRVTFIGNVGEFEVSIEPNGELEVRGIYGSAEMAIIPHVTNSIRVRIAKERPTQ